MSKISGFISIKRQEPHKQEIPNRIRHFNEFETPLPYEALADQATRCMDCGIPYCHACGCPLSNLIPDWNNMVRLGHWQRALDLLHATNNFPEITGRICPAPCEFACILAINQEPVLIKHIELQIAEKGCQEGWIKPEPANVSTNKRVAIIGSGPAGLSAAQQLVRGGHTVVVFEKSDRIGGLLRYGIPDFKLEKWVIDRRLAQMQSEGVIFEPDVEVGVDISARYLSRNFDAVIIATGESVPRDLNIPGRNLEGIHFAMEYLSQQNRRNNGESIPKEKIIDAKNKHVIVIGGGDTGADCIGTAGRQGATQITQIELLPQPPTERTSDNPWPYWPKILRTSSSHAEGCQRLWSILTKSFVGNNQHVTGLHCIKLDWRKDSQSGHQDYSEIFGSEFELKADLVLIATGFIHAEHSPLLQKLALEQNPKGNIKVDSGGMTSASGVFAVGDCVSGASLVVNAIQQGRWIAKRVHQFLINKASND